VAASASAVSSTISDAARRDQMLRWMRRRRLAALVFAILTATAFGFAWLAWRGNQRRECAILLGSGVLLAVLAVGFLLMYAVLAVGESRLEADSSPRKYGVPALVALLGTILILSVDAQNFLRNRAWAPLGCGQRYCTFARADYPMGFWISHAFVLFCALMCVRAGVIAVGKWWRASRMRT